MQHYQLEFRPTLGEAVHSVLSTLSPQVVVSFSVRLPSSQWDLLVGEGARVEVWSDLPRSNRAPGLENSNNDSREWSPLAFQFSEDPLPRCEFDNAYIVDLRADAQQPGSSQSSDSIVELVAWTYIPTPPVNDPLRIAFTYRIVYPSGHIRWLGEFGQNGSMIVRSEEGLGGGGVVLSPVVGGWHAIINDASSSEDGTSCLLGGGGGVGWYCDVEPREGDKVEEREGCVVGYIEDMHDYLIWALGSESVSCVQSQREAQDDGNAQAGDLNGHDADADVWLDRAAAKVVQPAAPSSSILIFVPDPRRRRRLGRYASSTAFALVCSPGVQVTLGSWPRGDTSNGSEEGLSSSTSPRNKICIIASRPGRMYLEYDNLDLGPSHFLQKILTHSRLADHWTLLKQNDDDDEAGSQSDARAMVIYKNIVDTTTHREHDAAKVNFEDHHQTPLPIQVAVIPLLPTMTSNNLVTFGLDPVVDEMQNFVSNDDPTARFRVDDIVLFADDCPRNGIHVLVDSALHRRQGLNPIKLVLTLNHHGSIVSFSPIHALEAAAGEPRRSMKFVIVSPFSPDTGKCSMKTVVDSDAFTLPTPPLSPRPSTTIPAPTAMITPAGSDTVVVSELVTEINPPHSPSPSSTTSSPSTRPPKSAPPPLPLKSGDTHSSTSTTTSPSRSPPGPASPAPSSDEKAVIHPRRQRSFLTICPPFGSLVTTLLRSILVSVTTIFRFVCGTIIVAPWRHLVAAAAILNRPFGVWRPTLGGRRRSSGSGSGSMGEGEGGEPEDRRDLDEAPSSLSNSPRDRGAAAAAEEDEESEDKGDKVEDEEVTEDPKESQPRLDDTNNGKSVFPMPIPETAGGPPDINSSSTTRLRELSSVEFTPPGRPAGDDDLMPISRGGIQNGGRNGTTGKITNPWMSGEGTPSRAAAAAAARDDQHQLHQQLVIRTRFVESKTKRVVLQAIVFRQDKDEGTQNDGWGWLDHEEEQEEKEGGDVGVAGEIGGRWPSKTPLSLSLCLPDIKVFGEVGGSGGSISSNTKTTTKTVPGTLPVWSVRDRVRLFNHEISTDGRRHDRCASLSDCLFVEWRLGRGEERQVGRVQVVQIELPPVV